MKYRKIIISFVIIPLGILLISFLLYASSIYLKDGRFLSIVKPVDRQKIIEEDRSIISGELPNGIGRMGTVIVHFNQPNSPSGSILFTVTEQTTRKILYQNEYSMHDIYYKNSFPFGFPPVEQGRGEKYVFSISPANQSNTDFLTLSNQEYPYEVLYQFDRNFLLHNPQATQTFLRDKFSQYGFYMLHSRNILFYVFPVILYYLFSITPSRYGADLRQSSLYQKLRKYMHPVLCSLTTIIFIVSILLNQLPDLFLLMLSLFWIILVLHYRLKPAALFFLALFFLLSCPLLIVSDMEQAASNIASWSFVFILIGSIHGLGAFPQKITIPFIPNIDLALKHQYRRLQRYIS